MSSVNALSTSPDAHTWLMKSRHPRILHIFDQACNLISEQGDILSIVLPKIGNGPFNIVIREDVCFSEHLRLESQFSISPTKLIFEDLTINIDDAELWLPHPDWKKLHDRRDKIFNFLSSLPILNHQPPIGDSTAPHLSESSVATFFSALVIADLSTTKTCTSKLAGLGVGLTPAGDDLILGAILAAWIIHPPEIASILAKEVTSIAAPLTTSLSAAWLRSASNGEAGIYWHELFDVLTCVDRTGNPAYGIAVQEAMDDILSIGETSGADALAGFLGVFKAYKERIIDQCPS